MQVGIVLGSRSQWSTMQHTANLLAQLGIPYEARIITENKNSNKLHDYASKAINRGLEIIIAGTTKKSCLPDIITSTIKVPVLGIQINTPARKENTHETNADKQTGTSISTHSTGPENATNAALFAASMLAKKHPRIRKNLISYRSQNGCDQHAVNY